MALPNSLQTLKKHLRKKAAILIMENFADLDTRVANISAGVPENGSITAAKLAADAVEEAKIKNGAVVEGKLGTGAVTSGKIGTGAVTAAKLSGELKSGSGAGYTIALVTAAFGDPATLSDAFTGIYKDTTATKYYVVVVFDDIFVAEELTAVPAA